MPNITLYINKQSIPIWKSARTYARRKKTPISDYITGLLKHQGLASKVSRSARGNGKHKARRRKSAKRARRAAALANGQ